MPVMDEFKEERQAIKNRPFKEKLSYFFDYYKFHVLGTIIGVVAIVSLIYTFATRKDIAFYAVILNAMSQESAEEYSNTISDYLEIDSKEYDVLFDTSMYIDFETMDKSTLNSSQKFLVYMTSSQLDVVISDTASLEHYSYLDTFRDLREILSEEQLEKYEPYFFYADGKVLQERKTANENGDPSYVVKYPENPSDPTTMTDPIPIGLYVQDSADLKTNFIFTRDDLILTVMQNTKHLDYCLKYIDYVFDQILSESHIPTDTNTQE